MFPIIVFDLKPYLLTLRSPFGTAHSASTQRTNMLLTLNVESKDTSVVLGYGEVGLPPKKSGCYETSLDDLFEFGSAFQKILNDVYSIPKEFGWLGSVPDCYCRRLRLIERGTSTELFCIRFFYALDQTALAFRNQDSNDAFVDTAISLFEMAAFDVLGRFLCCPVYSLLIDDAFKPRFNKSYSFYTVALVDDIELMLKSAEYGLQYTPLLKIKLDHDLNRSHNILTRLIEYCDTRENRTEIRFSIDCNACWTDPDDALRFLNDVIPLLLVTPGRLVMVEQPFPLLRAYEGIAQRYRRIVQKQLSKCLDKTDNTSHMGLARDVVDFVDEEFGKSQSLLSELVLFKDHSEFIVSPFNDIDLLNRWCAVADAYKQAGIPIYGDESVSNAADVYALRPLLHGVNVKLEKAGGYRGALRVMAAASECGLTVWLGTMLGSLLNCNGAAQLLPLAQYGDIDGCLLCHDHCQRFEGGFRWGDNGYIEFGDDLAGLGVHMKMATQVDVNSTL